MKDQDFNKTGNNMLRKIVFFSFLGFLYYCGRMDTKPEQAPYELAGGASAYGHPYSPYHPYFPYSPYRPHWPYGPYGMVNSGSDLELPDVDQVDINELMQ